MAEVELRWPEGLTDFVLGGVRLPRDRSGQISVDDSLLDQLMAHGFKRTDGKGLPGRPEQAPPAAHIVTHEEILAARAREAQALQPTATVSQASVAPQAPPRADARRTAIFGKLFEMTTDELEAMHERWVNPPEPEEPEEPEAMPEPEVDLTGASEEQIRGMHRNDLFKYLRQTGEKAKPPINSEKLLAMALERRASLEG